MFRAQVVCLHNSLSIADQWFASICVSTMPVRQSSHSRCFCDIAPGFGLRLEVEVREAIAEYVRKPKAMVDAIVIRWLSTVNTQIGAANGNIV